MEMLKYQKTIIWPCIHYWGFFINYFEMPKIDCVKISFRIRKKENILLIAFLSFFFKCFFLNNRIFFKLSQKKLSQNLYLQIKISKKNNDFYYFFLFVKLVFSFFNKNEYNFNGTNLMRIGKKKKIVFNIDTKNISKFLFEVLRHDFFYLQDDYFNNILYNLHFLFLNIFFSEKNFKLNTSISLIYNLELNYNFFLQKLLYFTFNNYNINSKF